MRRLAPGEGSLQDFCKRQKGENGPCRTPANAKKEKTAFAELLQASKRRKWLLQDFCKRQKGENGFCRTSASAKKEEMAFAELLQTSKWRKRPLQNFCKRQNGENGLCRTSANVKMEKMAFAGLLQAPKRRKWPLQNFCKRFQKRFGYRVASVEASLLVLCLHRTHIKSKEHAELALFCFFCVDRKQMV